MQPFLLPPLALSNVRQCSVEVFCSHTFIHIHTALSSPCLSLSPAVFLLLRLQLQQGRTAAALQTADSMLRRELSARDPVHFLRALMHTRAHCLAEASGVHAFRNAAAAAAAAAIIPAITDAATAASSSPASSAPSTPAASHTTLGAFAVLAATTAAPTPLVDALRVRMRTDEQETHVCAIRDLAIELIKHKCVIGRLE